jgi:hypothetical protein
LVYDCAYIFASTKLVGTQEQYQIMPIPL